MCKEVVIYSGWCWKGEIWKLDYVLLGWVVLVNFGREWVVCIILLFIVVVCVLEIVCSGVLFLL